MVVGLLCGAGATPSPLLVPYLLAVSMANLQRLVLCLSYTLMPPPACEQQLNPKRGEIDRFPLILFLWTPNED
jgi:hypothetical protein